MIIDLKQLKQKGEYKKSLVLSYFADNSLLLLPNTQFGSEVTINLSLEIFDGEVDVSGKISFDLKALCSRCLKPIVHKTSFEFSELFQKEPVNNDLAFPYCKDSLNLQPMVEELILTNMPQTLYCVDSCKGLCPVCGVNLNLSSCGCINKE